MYLDCVRLLIMNCLSLQPKTALSCLLLSCSHRSHQFKPLHASPIDFPSCSVSINLPHDSIVRGGKWDVMRCELSPRKCCCPHLSPDSASSFVCVHPLLSAAAGCYLSIPLSGLCVWLPLQSLSGFLFLPLTSISPSLLSSVSSDWSFVLLFLSLLSSEFFRDRGV